MSRCQNALYIEHRKQSLYQEHVQKCWAGTAVPKSHVFRGPGAKLGSGKKGAKTRTYSSISLAACIGGPRARLQPAPPPATSNALGRICQQNRPREKKPETARSANRRRGNTCRRRRRLAGPLRRKKRSRSKKRELEKSPRPCNGCCCCCCCCC